jgi:hypothetical protein
MPRKTRETPVKVKATETPALAEPISRSEAEVRARDARLAATLDLQNLSDRERAFLAICQKLHRGDRGCDTPFEEFFCHLVFLIEHDRWPTPDDVAEELDSFRENFKWMRETAKSFFEAYPDSEAPNAS